jgi:hypothetical protein
MNIGWLKGNDVRPNPLFIPGCTQCIFGIIVDWRHGEILGGTFKHGGTARQQQPPTQIQRHYGEIYQKLTQLLQKDLLQKITFSPPPKEPTHAPKIPPHVLLRFLN